MLSPFASAGGSEEAGRCSTGGRSPSRALRVPCWCCSGQAMEPRALSVVSLSRAAITSRLERTDREQAPPAGAGTDAGPFALLPRVVRHSTPIFATG